MAESLLQREIKRKQSFDVIEQEAFLNILRTNGLLLLHMSRFLKEYDLSPPQYNILRILRGAGDEGIPCQDISNRMVSPVPDVTRLVDRLAKAGLAARRRGKQDRRVVRVIATPAARKLLARIDGPIMDLHKQLLGHMDRQELEALNRLMAKARRADDINSKA